MFRSHTRSQTLRQHSQQVKSQESCRCMRVPDACIAGKACRHPHELNHSIQVSRCTAWAPWLPVQLLALLQYKGSQAAQPCPVHPMPNARAPPVPVNHDPRTAHPSSGKVTKPTTTCLPPYRHSASGSDEMNSKYVDPDAPTASTTTCNTTCAWHSD